MSISKQGYFSGQHIQFRSLDIFLSIYDIQIITSVTCNYILNDVDFMLFSFTKLILGEN